MPARTTTQTEVTTERLRRVLPGGDTRSATYYPPQPVVLDSGSGCHLRDVDGNTYVDLWNNYTALAHGNAHPKVVAALEAHLQGGTVFPAPHVSQADLGEKIQERIPSVELLRYTNSGTEAVMLAVRAARAVTGRDVIVKADGGYHGAWEQLPMSLDGGLGAGGHTPQATIDLVRTCGFNDVDSLTSLMHDVGNRTACVILEPVLTAGGVIVGDPEFFRVARALCDEYGALLVLDEIVTFRLGVGGYQQILGVEPDLTTLGKIIGGGLPVGATGGRRDILELFDPTRKDFVGHSGTFNGNVLTMVAGATALDLLDAGEIDRINALGAALAGHLATIIRDARVPGDVTSCGSLVHVHFETNGPVSSFGDTNLGSPLLQRVHRACLDHGLFFAGRGLLCTSTPMTPEMIDEVAERFQAAMVAAV